MPESPSLPQFWSTTIYKETPSRVPRCCRTCSCQAQLPQAKPVSSLYCGYGGIGRASTSNSPLPPAACSTEPLARLHDLCKFCRLLIRCRLQNHAHRLLNAPAVRHRHDGGRRSKTATMYTQRPLDFGGEEAMCAAWPSISHRPEHRPRITTL